LLKSDERCAHVFGTAKGELGFTAVIESRRFIRMIS
jgi:hypothetical protein